jgi:hypothetical protein
MSKIDVISLTNSKKFSITLLNLLILSYFILVSFRSIPDPTHFFVSELSLDEIKEDKLNEIINFIKTPFYKIINFIFKDLLIYNFFSIIINFFLLNIVYLGLNSFLKNNLNSLITLSSIIFLKFILIISTFFNYEILNFAHYITMNIDILSNFTIRQIYGVLYLISFYLILKNHHYYAAIIIFLNFFTHPNSNIIFLSILLPFYFYFFIKQKDQWKNIFFLNVFLTFIALVILFLKISNFNYIVFYENNLSNNFYYNSLIKDEADDFSFLWLLAYKTEEILIGIILILTNCYIYLKKYKSDQLIYFSLFPIIILILGIIIEYLNLFFQIEFIFNFIINLQPAWKLLGYSFFPSILILGKNLNKINFLDSKKIKICVVLFIITTIVTFSTVGLLRNSKEILTFYSYAYKTNSNNYEDWLMAQTGKENFYLLAKYADTNDKIYSLYPNESNIFNIKKLNKNYQKYNFIDLHKNYDTFKLIKQIKKFIPENSGIILPPYFFNARGIFHDYFIFFQEHPDGNFAMGNKKFFRVINERMETLLKTNYKIMPNKQSKLNYTYLRQKYMLVDKDRLVELKKKYPKYNYIISENLNIKDLEIIFSDNVFAIYKF